MERVDQKQSARPSPVILTSLYNLFFYTKHLVNLLGREIFRLIGFVSVGVLFSSPKAKPAPVFLQYPGIGSGISFGLFAELQLHIEMWGTFLVLNMPYIQ